METCLRCNYSWSPRIKVVKICPKCKSKYFREEKLGNLFSRNNSIATGWQLKNKKFRAGRITESKFVKIKTKQGKWLIVSANLKKLIHKKIDIQLNI